jgi:energy-coupling factor transporter ATP-binding protein EcfA2
MTFVFSIPTPQGVKDFALDQGGSIIFVGANGGGKTRLAVYVEQVLGSEAHRISAHRALTLNPEVAKISEPAAIRGLRFGHVGPGHAVGHRSGNRWRNKDATQLLNDFDFLIQVLFADQSNTSLKAYNQIKPGGSRGSGPVELTKFDKLKEIWQRLLPHRELIISGDDITVTIPETTNSYTASDMSDGERAIFYMIGQVLVAADNQVLIVDEPELHVHRSIMSKLWDELEGARTDCAFIFITHDLEFAATRTAQKFVIRDYNTVPSWTIDPVPVTSGFDEELTTLILGSRKPILFVEGNYSSLDIALYRCCYPDFTILPRSTCTEVIHSVATFRANEQLTRVKCSGIVDADHYTDREKQKLEQLGIKTLPVAEIENIFVHPLVSRSIAFSNGYRDEELNEVLDDLASDLFAKADSEDKIEAVAVRYAKRRIDRLLKTFDLSDATSVDLLAEQYIKRTEELDVAAIAQVLRDDVKSALEARDLPRFLLLVDDKSFLASAASKLKRTNAQSFKDWLTRTLRNKSEPEVVKAVKDLLPQINP